jgi:hypothetical protein
MPRVYATATITAGQSLSSPIDCRSGAPVLLFMPLAWTAARISYQLSFDGSNFRDLCDRAAREIAVNVSAGTVVRLNPEWTESALGCYLKIRSGSRDMATVQTADRSFTLLIDTSVGLVTAMPAQQD